MSNERHGDSMYEHLVDDPKSIDNYALSKISTRN